MLNITTFKKKIYPNLHSITLSNSSEIYMTSQENPSTDGLRNETGLDWLWSASLQISFPSKTDCYIIVYGLLEVVSQLNSFIYILWEMLPYILISSFNSVFSVQPGTGKTVEADRQKCPWRGQLNEKAGMVPSVETQKGISGKLSPDTNPLWKPNRCFPCFKWGLSAFYQTLLSTCIHVVMEKMRKVGAHPPLLLSLCPEC